MPSGAISSAGATVAGQTVDIPGRTGFFVEIVLRLATLVGVLALIAGGILLLWLAPVTTDLAMSAVRRHPWRSLGVGLSLVVLVPVVIGLLAITLVGIPFAVMLLLLGIVAWFYGAVPVLAVVGQWALRGRGGVFAGFVVAALVWRLASIFIPWVGVLVLVAGIAWGSGAWATGVWENRRRTTMAAPGSPVRVEPS